MSYGVHQIALNATIYARVGRLDQPTFIVGLIVHRITSIASLHKWKALYTQSARYKFNNAKIKIFCQFLVVYI